MVTDLLAAGISRIVLDHVDEGQQARDRRLLARRLRSTT